LDIYCDFTNRLGTAVHHHTVLGGHHCLELYGTVLCSAPPFMNIVFIRALLTANAAQAPRTSNLCGYP
jgi:hypothetical protein